MARIGVFLKMSERELSNAAEHTDCDIASEIETKPEIIKEGICDQAGQSDLKQALQSNPNQIEGSVGQHLAALKPGMTIADALTAQTALNSRKSTIDPFAIITDDGDLVVAKNNSPAARNDDQILIAEGSESANYVRSWRAKDERLTSHNKGARILPPATGKRQIWKDYRTTRAKRNGRGTVCD